MPCGWARKVISGPNSSTRPRPSGASTTATAPSRYCCPHAQPLRSGAVSRTRPRAAHALLRGPAQPERRAVVEEHVHVASRSRSRAASCCPRARAGSTRERRYSIARECPVARRRSLDQRVGDRHAKQAGDGRRTRRSRAGCRRPRRTRAAAARVRVAVIVPSSCRYSTGRRSTGGASSSLPRASRTAPFGRQNQHVEAARRLPASSAVRIDDVERELEALEQPARPAAACVDPP